MKHLWDCDAVTLTDVAGFGLVDAERTAVDFFVDERALGCAFSHPSTQTTATTPTDPGEEPQKVDAPRDEVTRSEPAAATSKRPRRNVAEGNIPVPREDTLTSEAEPGRRGRTRGLGRAQALGSVFSWIGGARSLGCSALVVSAGVLLVWPDVLPRLPGPAFLAATTSLHAVASGTTPCAPPPAPAKVSAATPGPADERAAAEAFIAALAAAHPADEAYREAARVLRDGSKNSVNARRP